MFSTRFIVYFLVYVWASVCVYVRVCVWVCAWVHTHKVRSAMINSRNIHMWWKWLCWFGCFSQRVLLLILRFSSSVQFTSFIFTLFYLCIPLYCCCRHRHCCFVVVVVGFFSFCYFFIFGLCFFFYSATCFRWCMYLRGTKSPKPIVVIVMKQK